jgi:hypothetical protein
MIRVRGCDGATREVDDEYILRDGESIVVPLMLMDAKGISMKRMITDGHGNPAGQRPGFLIADNDERALDEAHRQYRADIERRWQSNRWQSHPSKGQLPEHKAQPTASPLAKPEAALAQAYAQYEADVQQRWRRRW